MFSVHSTSKKFESATIIAHFRFMFTALFNNSPTVTFKAQPTKRVFRYRQSNVRRLLPASDYCRVRFVVWTVLSDLITAHSAIAGSWKEPPNIWLTVAKNAFVGWALNFRVRMLLKSAVKKTRQVTQSHDYRDVTVFKMFSFHTATQSRHLQVSPSSRAFSERADRKK